MAQLRCPSCQADRAVPFVRVGAVTRCPRCGVSCRVQADHMLIGPAAGPAADAPAPAPDGDPYDLAEALPEDVLGGSTTVGLSGLSELMQDEPKAPPLLAVPKPPPPAPARADTHRSQRRLVLTAAVLMAAVLAAAGVAVMLLGPADPETPRDHPIASKRVAD